MTISWRTIDDLANLCRANLAAIRALNPDVVVGIPRSGMLPASILSLGLDIPLSDLHSFCRGKRWARSGFDKAESCRAKRILLVDDATGFGKTMSQAIHQIRHARTNVQIMTCGVFATEEAAARLTIAFDICPKPRIFEWNWFRNGGALKDSCVDIDGVLCLDPTGKQKRDADAYRNFVLNAVPLFRTQYPVHAFVTGRSSEFRAETEAWLDRHGFKYGALKMLDGKSPRTAEGHARLKADFYTSSGATLFIESNPAQAEMIAKISGKQCLCITTRDMHQ